MTTRAYKKCCIIININHQIISIMTLHQSSGNWKLGLLLTLLTVFLWGILPIALKVTLQGLDPYTVTAFRFLVSFSLLGTFLASQKSLPTLKELQATSGKLLAIAIIFLSTNYILFLIGLKLTSPANAQVLIQLAPVLMGFGGLVIFKERYNLRQWIGVGTLTLGFILFFNEKLKVLIEMRSQYLLGTFIIIIAAAAWAVYSLAQKQLLKQLPSSSIMLILYGSCGLLFTPFSSFSQILNINTLQLGMLIFCAFNTLIAYGAFAESLQHWEASKVSAILATTPIVTLISMQVLSLLQINIIAPEKITLLGIFGAFLVVTGSIAIALKNK
jgi:drug/metabolite transporter (DMT)-like permease